MNRLSKVISDLSYEDIRLLDKDLRAGNIEKLINKRIKHFEDGGKTLCPVCHTTIEDPENNGFKLVFGPVGFRKKASFCATDCLEYFVQKIKSTNMKRLEEDGTAGNNKDF